MTLRDLRTSDAPALAALLTREEVTRFISPPPATIQGFERFIAWTNAQRVAGEYICFAVVPRGCEMAAGIIQIRRLDRDFRTAEWGFAVAEEWWGTGLFMEAATLVLAFVFDCVGVHRLEARAAVENRRGNGALRKLGAFREGVLRKSFPNDEGYLDQLLWSILEPDWRCAANRHAPAHQTLRWVH